MKRIHGSGIMIVLLAAFFLFAGLGLPLNAAEKTGESLFKEHCVMCHPDGGNIINPKKTLHKKDREGNNIRTEGDIIKTMRNPGPGMTTFDVKAVADKDAEEIAKYILKIFNK